MRRGIHPSPRFAQSFYQRSILRYHSLSLEVGGWNWDAAPTPSPSPNVREGERSSPLAQGWERGDGGRGPHPFESVRLSPQLQAEPEQIPEGSQNNADVRSSLLSRQAREVAYRHLDDAKPLPLCPHQQLRVYHGSF
jgi:hypothetical protein